MLGYTAERTGEVFLRFSPDALPVRAVIDQHAYTPRDNRLIHARSYSVSARTVVFDGFQSWIAMVICHSKLICIQTLF